MMDRIKLTQAVANQLKAYHLSPGKKVESLSFALDTSTRETNGELVVSIATSSDLLFLNDDCFDDKSPARVEVPADVRAGVLTRALARKREGQIVVVINTHDHWFATEAAFSATDDDDDISTARQLEDLDTQYLKPDQKLIGVSILMAQGAWAARRVEIDPCGSANFIPMRIDILGERLEYHDYSLKTATSPAWANRQTNIIDPPLQTIMEQLRLVIVGGGGTGSIALEAALRMGFRKIDIIDADSIEVSNLNRFQGASTSDVGQLKAVFLAERGCKLFPDAQVTAITTDAFSAAATQAFAQADILLGCVDNSETRWYLNRVSIQYLLPYLDCGNLIQLGSPAVYHSRVNVIIPGLTPCGHCSDIQFMPRKRPDTFLDERTLQAQRSAGYVEDHPKQQAAATYILNMQTVSALFFELSNLLTTGNAAHSLYVRSDCIEKKIERLDRSNYRQGPADDCPVCQLITGLGDDSPLPRVGGEAIAPKHPCPRAATQQEHQEKHHGQF